MGDEGRRRGGGRAEADFGSVITAAVPTGSRMKWWFAGGLAAAVVVLAMSVVPGLVRQNRVNRAMQDLVAAVGTNRFAEARLSDDFAWGPRPATLGSGRRSSLPARVLEATSRIQILTDGQDDGWMLRARGISALATGDIPAAIQALEQAVAAEPLEPRPRTDRRRRSSSAIACEATSPTPTPRSRG